MSTALHNLGSWQDLDMSIETASAGVPSRAPLQVLDQRSSSVGTDIISGSSSVGTDIISGSSSVGTDIISGSSSVGTDIISGSSSVGTDIISGSSSVGTDLRVFIGGYRYNLRAFFGGYISQGLHRAGSSEDRALLFDFTDDADVFPNTERDGWAPAALGGPGWIYPQKEKEESFVPSGESLDFPAEGSSSQPRTSPADLNTTCSSCVI
ncbi:hypothetical protein EYF80_053762 [Liparis tanakae]|uniref:Uncharacterized protein n=1 Tax=Liparis tanakae TaxID=230148 RepID=A0A4Z2F5E1_9TELE|nr:hypothetical protein EYF80_053762 [Liparis tanakae]